MQALDALASDRAPGGEVLRRRGERRLHRPHQRPHVAGRDEPAAGIVEKFGDAGDAGRDDGPAEGEGLHDDHGQTLGEARQEQGAAGGDVLAHLGIARPAVEDHPIRHVVAPAGGLDLFPALAVADQDHLEVGIAPAQGRHRRRDRRLRLGGAEASDADEGAVVGPLGLNRRELLERDPAARDADLGRVLRPGQVREAVAAEIGDRDDELRVRDLLGKAEALRRLELVRPVGGEAVARAAHQPGQHRHGGGVGGEVDVDVVDALGRRAPAQAGRLEQVGDRAHPSVAGGPGEPQPRAEAAAEAERVEQRFEQGGGEQPGEIAGQQVMRRGLLRPVAGIDQRLRPRPDRVAPDPASEEFERLDLTPDEGRARQRIGVHQIRDLHGRVSFDR